MRAALALAAGLCVAATGCIGAPNPLAPHLRGSVGVPHHGVVTDAVAMPKKGDGYVLFRDDGVRWGSQRLIDILLRAAAKVSAERPGGSPLVVGDLSERFGGETTRHRSHRTGRDVDLLFYVTTPRGVPVRSPGFVPFESDGLGVSGSKKVYRFDVERNWALVRSFLVDEDVQWVFVSRPIEALLTEYALALGEPVDILWRAETVMRQPGDSAPHDDHFHVRLACSVDEMVAGCQGGPRWPWQATVTPVEVSDAELLEALLED